MLTNAFISVSVANKISVFCKSFNNMGTQVKVTYGPTTEYMNNRDQCEKFGGQHILHYQIIEVT